MKTSLQTLISELEAELKEREGCNGAINIGHKYGLKQAIQVAERLLPLERQHLLDLQEQLKQQNNENTN